MPANRDELGHFVKGASGNPDGRPAIAKLVRDLCRENAVGRIEEVIGEIYQLALHGRGMVKLEAAKYLCDRVGGKPTAEVTGRDGGPLRLELSGGLADFVTSLDGGE